MPPNLANTIYAHATSRIQIELYRCTDNFIDILKKKSALLNFSVYSWNYQLTLKNINLKHVCFKFHVSYLYIYRCLCFGQIFKDLFGLSAAASNIGLSNTSIGQLCSNTYEAYYKHWSKNLSLAITGNKAKISILPFLRDWIHLSHRDLRCFLGYRGTYFSNYTCRYTLNKFWAKWSLRNSYN